MLAVEYYRLVRGERGPVGESGWEDDLFAEFPQGHTRMEYDTAVKMIGHVFRTFGKPAPTLKMVPGFDDCTEVLNDPRAELFGAVGHDPELLFWFDAPNMVIVP